MTKVLVIEDDKDLNTAYRLVLERNEIEVQTAFNGEEAIETLKKFKPDVILLDLLMPVKNGVQFLKEYHPNKHPDVKILVFTNFDNAPEINEALKLGAHKCVIKAWTGPQNLMQVINVVMSEGKPEARTPRYNNNLRKFFHRTQNGHA